MVALSSLGEGEMKLNVRALAVIAIAGLVTVSRFRSWRNPRRRPRRSTRTHASRSPLASRILLRRMTLDEKAAQLQTVWEHKDKIQTPDGTFSPDKRVAELPRRHRPDRAPLRPPRRDPKQRWRRCRGRLPWIAMRARPPNISTPRSIGR